MWWLVVNQNPLKKQNQKKTLLERIESAKSINKNHKIKVLNLEYNIGTNFSYETIVILKNSLPNINFFWIIGADNLCKMHLWYKWKKLFYKCPVVVFNRPGYLNKALSSKAARYFWKKKVEIKSLKNFSKKSSLPLWSFVNMRTNRLASSSMRDAIKKRSDL